MKYKDEVKSERKSYGSNGVDDEEKRIESGLGDEIFFFFLREWR